ncbi:hypothetical protein SDC9_76970 [bioreactor metagenome]|uniref:Uncharacterized protein n=1 Tax=bioreactor metagenome TaxID=1076179 RepID=A0A644YPN3_9ZZZZ
MLQSCCYEAESVQHCVKKDIQRADVKSTGIKYGIQNVSKTGKQKNGYFKKQEI